jgi:NAD(P)-dependent dehydrogenase (short-subunit alcohol dehydrogenase family)
MIKQLVECSALEGAYYNIRVNGVAAGVTRTKARMNRDEFTGMKLNEIDNNAMIDMLGKDVPLGGLPNNPDHVAHSILYLGSEDA